MVSKKYATQEDILNEIRIAEILAPMWEVEFKKMPDKYTLDWCVVFEKGVRAWAELKCRTKHPLWQYGKWGGVFLALNKAIEAQAAQQVVDRPFLFVVEAKDGLFVAVFKEMDTHQYEIEWNGRTYRNDPNDLEPCILVPSERFVPVSRLKRKPTP